ncbi:MAG: hypothetical protein ACP5MT_01270 [Candidatus Acidifodinimicrobium sp.]
MANNLEELIDNAFKIAVRYGSPISKGIDGYQYENHRVFINYTVDYRGRKYLTIEKCPTYETVLNIKELEEYEKKSENRENFAFTHYGDFKILHYREDPEAEERIKSIYQGIIHGL